MSSAGTKTAVAWIGLGTMGGPMALRLAGAGFSVTAWNRSASRTAPLVAKGGRAARTPRDASSTAGIVFVMVSSPAALDEVLGGADGVVAGLAPGSLLVDLGTDGVAAAREAAGAASARGASFVDAPVLGSLGPARSGRLVVMAGGASADVDRLRPVLAPLAREVRHVGPVGSGQAMKLCTNLMLAHMLSGLAGAVGLAEAAGLSAADLVAILAAGVGADYFRVKGGQMVEGDFEPQFTLDLARKDVGLIREALAGAGTRLPTIDAIRDLFDEAARRGWGGEDGAGVVKLFRS